jgi:molybdate transport system substrate-binding protein
LESRSRGRALGKRLPGLSALLWLPFVLLLVSSARAADLTVFAAASLTDAFQPIGRAFERAHPGTHVAFDFAGSSLLRTQIEHGAPCDVFVSADWEQMSPLVRARTVKGAAPFARNRLVVVIPAANPGRIHQLADLARPGLRLVLTGEQVPIGRYSRLAIARMSSPSELGAGYQRRVLANVVSRELNVRALLTKVTLGEADAAFVYASDAVAAGKKVLTVAIPSRVNEIAVYPAAVLASSTQPREAAAFLQFLRSAPARAVLKRYGFDTR